MFFFTRHGRTASNATGMMCGGQSDVPLTDEGLAQARALAAWAQKERSHLRGELQIVHSPLTRAQHTADILSQALQPARLVQEPDLIDWCVGDWDARPWTVVGVLIVGSVDPPGGETRDEFSKRVVRAFDRHSSSFAQAPTLIVAHGLVGVALQRHLSTGPIVRMPNCCFAEFARSGPTWAMQKVFSPDQSW